VLTNTKCSGLVIIVPMYCTTVTAVGK